MIQTILRIAIVISMFFISATLFGCATWLQQWKDNPNAAVITFRQESEQVVTGVNLLWQEIKPQLPPEKAADIEKKLFVLEVAYNHSLDALTDAVHASQNMGNIQQLIVDVIRVVGDIVAVVNDVRPILSNGQHRELPDVGGQYAKLKANWVR